MTSGSLHMPSDHPTSPARDIDEAHLRGLFFAMNGAGRADAHDGPADTPAPARYGSDVRAPVRPGDGGATD